MSIERAVALLSSVDTGENVNGAALLINSAATAANVPTILSANVIPLLLPKLNSNNDDLVMKAAWAVNNLCVHDKARDAVYAARVLDYFPNVLKSKDPETIKKTCWALTNLARNQNASKDIVRGPIFPALIQCLNVGSNDEQRGFALQPLCNLVLDPENQLAFQKNGGIPPTVKLLGASHDKSKELAVTLVSFVTTNHDSIRETLCDAGALKPLCNIINGDGTPKMQELAVNSLVNLSLAESAERAILREGAVKPIVGLLASEVPKLQQQAAMLLSNLLTNREIREHIRYLGWVDPVIEIVKSGDVAIVQQILRVVINITFDAHCRYLLACSDAEKHVANVTKRLSDPQVNQLSTTALKNLSVPAAPDVQKEVEDIKKSNGLLSAVTPHAQKRDQKTNDLDGLDDLIGSITSGNRNVSSPTPSGTSSSRSNYGDGLDDLLGDLDTPSKLPSSQAKPSAAKPAPASKPTPAAGRSANNKAFDDLDDLLADVSAPSSKGQPSSSGALSDIDDLLADIGGPSKPQAKPASKAPTPSRAPPSKSATDDIDDLLADIGTSTALSRGGQPASYPNRNKAKQDLDDIDSLLDGINISAPQKSSPSVGDIDDLLADIETPSHKSRPTSSYGSSRGGDDIDDLLNGLDSSRSGGGMDAIDDLLADLTG